MSVPPFLLRQFDRATESYCDVSRLRGFILDLAVRGSLVRQDPSDQPARELLKEIQAEKASVVGGRVVKSTIGVAPASPSRFPFVLPGSWVWVRLGDVVAKLTDGTHHSPPNLPEGPFKYITAKNIKADGISLAEITYVSAEVHQDIYARCNPEFGDVLYIKDGATTGVVTVNDLHEPFSMLSSVALLKLPRGISNHLLVAFLRSPFFYDQMRGEMKGSGLPRVTLTRMVPAMLPLPPLAEQGRIVAKVDELMALCDQLERAQQEREMRRDGLRSESLQRLTFGNGDGPGGSANVQLFLRHAPRLITKTEHLAAVRQSILELAVRGRLVPQDSRDEHAALLLKRLVRGNNQQTKLVTVANADEAPAHREAETPFSVPTGWTWTQFTNVARIQSDLVDPANFGDLPLIAPDNIESRTGGLLMFQTTRDSAVTSSKHLFQPGVILYSKIRPALAKAVLVDFAGLCSADMYPILSLIDRQYLHKCMLSHVFVEQSIRVDNRVAMPKINQEALSAILVPVPPLAEQLRIVAKVDQLMAVCGQLEAALASAQGGRGQLLESVLHEALEGATVPELIGAG